MSTGTTSTIKHVFGTETNSALIIPLSLSAAAAWAARVGEQSEGIPSPVQSAREDVDLPPSPFDRIGRMMRGTLKEKNTEPSFRYNVNPET